MPARVAKAMPTTAPMRENAAAQLPDIADQDIAEAAALAADRSGRRQDKCARRCARASEGMPSR